MVGHNKLNSQSLLNIIDMIKPKRWSYKLDMESNTSRQARTSELVSYVGIVL